jgi:hypothetical protein
LSRRLQVGEVHKISTPMIQPSPLANGPKMISHGAHASQRRLLADVSFVSTAPGCARRRGSVIGRMTDTGDPSGD